MPKDRRPVTVVTSSERLSHAMDRVLRRFPGPDRPTKNALLNDLASVLSPGKNWGGLLDLHRKSESQPSANLGAKTPDLSRLIWGLRPQNEGPVTRLGAVERKLSGAGGIMTSDTLREPLSRQDLAAGMDEGTILGFVVGVSADGYEATVSPLPYAIVLKNGSVVLEHCFGHSLSSKVARTTIELLQAVWCTDWYGALTAEELTDTKVIVGPAYGACVLPRRGIEALARGKSLDKHDNHAPRFFMPEAEDIEDIDDPLPDLMASLKTLVRLAEMTLPVLCEIDRAFEIDIDLPGDSEKILTPMKENIPAPPWQGNNLLVVSNGKWSDQNDSAYVLSDRLSHVMGEALAFAIDFDNLATPEPLYILAQGHDPRSRDVNATVCPDWKIVCWKRGRLNEWLLADPAEHDRFRRRIEAWALQESVEISPAQDSGINQTRFVTARASYRNTRHWDRARTIFEDIQ